MCDFYERFMKDRGNAEENMTNIKRMEKPTDLTCEKCGKPLVIKWGKHGSFLACTGYPDFPVRSAESDLENLQKEIAKRQERARKDVDKRLEKIQARYPGSAIHWDEDGKFVFYPGNSDVPKKVGTDLKKAVTDRRK